MSEWKKRHADVPLSETTIPIRLADIRRKCRELLDDDGEIALRLEDAEPACSYNPYDRGI